MKVYTIAELDAMDTKSNLHERESKEFYKNVLALTSDVNDVLEHYWHKIPKDGEIYRRNAVFNTYDKNVVDQVIQNYAYNKIYLALVNGTLSIRLDKPF